MMKTKEFEGKMKEYAKTAEKILKAGTIAAADALLDDSTHIVPFDRGFSGGLASTATKGDITFTGGNLSVQVGYNKRYAARLHEDLSLNISQNNTVGGQTRSQKYLESPMKSNGKKYGKIISEFMKKI